MDVKTLCLGVLCLGDASGYQIKKAFETGPFAHFNRAGFGSIYPALRALAARGEVEGRDCEQTGRPDKRVYRITPSGRLALLRALEADPGEDNLRSDFLFLLFFADLLPKDRLRSLIEARLAWYDAKLAAMDACAEADLPEGARFVAGLGRAVYGAARRYLAEEGGRLTGDAAPQAAD